MNSPPAKKSQYQSRLRAEQAATTRRLVLDAASRLFVERGYTATSIDAIAQTAGVGRSTVFAASEGKPWLLKTAYDRAIVGDDEPLPLLQRPQARMLFEMTDPAEIVASYARILATAMPRVSAIYEVVRHAAGCDPEVGQLWKEIGKERLTGAERIAALLDDRDGLREGLSLDHARDIIWIYNDPALHYALVHARGWNQDHYLDWLTDNLYHLLG
jgi:Bacterial regulatory proteins, tetR family